jgi:tRNA(Ile)-lysidine synthase
MDYVSYGEFSKSIPIIRPLLDIWRDEIMSYCEDNDLAFTVDETNTDEVYTRNSIRASLIPFLEKYNPNFKQGLIRMSGILHDDDAFIRQYSEKMIKNVIYQQRKNFVEINIQVFTREITSHYSRLLTDLQVIVEKDRGYLFTDIHNLESEGRLKLENDMTEIAIPGFTPINKSWCLKSAVLPIDEIREIFKKKKRNYSAYLDLELTESKIFMRKWQAGDRYAPLGLSGHSMKLSDFWINKDFPKRLRADWPLIISNEQLIWIPGFQPSFCVRITESTKHVLQLIVEEN